MQLYSILVVDDEGFVLSTITSLLQCQKQWNLEVYSAYTGQDALAILSSTRIDILITDIRMPVMDGLTLVEKAHALWPECITMILTAYNSFDYAYEAIRIGVKAFVLKTEPDARLLEAVGEMIAAVDEQRSAAAVAPLDFTERNEINAQLLQSLLMIQHSKKHLQSIYRMLGIGSEELWLINIVSAKDADDFSTLESLIQSSLAQKGKVIAACQVDGELFLLVMPNTPVTSLYGALEIVQEHYCGDEEQDRISFVICNICLDRTSIFEERIRMKDFRRAVDGDMYGYVHLLPEQGDKIIDDHSVIDIVISYIQSHRGSDLSLRTLSEVVRYNPTYLSRLFRAKKGETLRNYIERIRLDYMYSLFSDRDLSLNDIADLLGFTSRSYFGRYVKRLTGQSPQQFRELLTGQVEDFI